MKPQVKEQPSKHRFFLLILLLHVILPWPIVSNAQHSKRTSVLQKLIKCVSEKEFVIMPNRYEILEVSTEVTTDVTSEDKQNKHQCGICFAISLGHKVKCLHAKP